MRKYLREKDKKKIVKRYIQGESITNIVREFWPNKKINNNRRIVYLWIKKYSTEEELKFRHLLIQSKKRYKKPKTFYSLKLKYNYAMRYLENESPITLARELLPNQDPYRRRGIFRHWLIQLKSKGIIKKNKIKKPRKKKINYEDFSREELLEILRIYDGYHEIIKDDKNKKDKFKAINKFSIGSIFSIFKLCKIFGVSKSGYYKSLKVCNKDKDMYLKKIVMCLYLKHKKVPGYRKMTYYVNKKLSDNKNYKQINHKKIYKVMTSLEIKSVIRVKKKKESKIIKQYREYLINRMALYKNLWE